MKLSANQIIHKVEGLIGKQKEILVGLSRHIHDHPETAFQEFEASKRIAALLEEAGFHVERNVAGISTAIKATFSSSQDGPAVAFLAEYDALPEIGHACGHNLIAASSVGAAMALTELVEETGGSVILLGTPAEENGGGKIMMIHGGAFDDVDFSLMMHPANRSLIGRNSTACSELVIEFTGRPAHSSKPEEGIDALYPLIQVFNEIQRQQQNYPPKVKINGIITAGGTASNVIVDKACGKFLIRAAKRDQVQMVIDQLTHFSANEAEKIGAGFAFSYDEIYAERYPNEVLEDRFKTYMEMQGEKMEVADPEEPAGSSDIGNVSMIMPIIHPYVSITNPEVAQHTREYAAASASERADEVMLKSAVALIAVGYELLQDEKLRKDTLETFKTGIQSYSQSY